jgi:hypothetical protein
MTFLKLVISFAPWIAFLIIAKGTLLRLEIGLVVALALTVLMALLRLHRGIIMWVGILFFTGATVAVLGFHDIWTIKHMGVMASGALAVGAWAGLLVGKPFSLAYARQNTDPALWHEPVFIRTNVIITATWATAFTINAALAWILMQNLLAPWAGHTLSYGVLIAAAAFTSWYPAHIRRAAQSTGRADSAAPAPPAR